MKPFKIYALVFVLLSSCSEEFETVDDSILISDLHLSKSFDYADNIPSHVVEILNREGFNVNRIINVDSGYIVENDIFFPESYFFEPLENGGKKSVGVENKHYHTNALVYPSRTIRIAVKSSPLIYHQALEIAIQRYNNLGLRHTFLKKVYSNNPSDIKRDKMMGTETDITLWAFYDGANQIWGTGSFPIQGRPGFSINLNRTTIENANLNVNAIATIIAHEIGHSIGFRHTDFMDRTFSCGPWVENPNEGVSSIGANHIPLSPIGPQFSWMQACNPGIDIPFTVNDISALQILYGPMN
ncbi:M57 family metalloprotease [Algoriphagus sp.]|uniref:M57 family metalloprotease n=1 Tax=Algoriphagus sp. TaxID=1872435 RepID=UPI00391C2697